MASLTFTPVYSFLENLAEKVHNLGSDTLKIMLSNAAPSQSSTVYANITQISAGTGYTTGGETVSISTSSQSGGTYTLVGTGTIVWTATGSFGAFRYAWLYNDTASSKELIGYYDHGSSITLASGDTYTINCAATILTLAPA